MSKDSSRVSRSIFQLPKSVSGQKKAKFEIENEGRGLVERGLVKCVNLKRRDHQESLSELYNWTLIKNQRSFKNRFQYPSETREVSMRSTLTMDRRVLWHFRAR